jgi:hypothetical protein
VSDVSPARAADEAFGAWWPRHAVRHNGRSPVAARAAFDVGWQAGAAAERERLLTALREFLPGYVTMVEQKYGCGTDTRIAYASGPVAFPDALVDTFALMSTPDADLLAAADGRDTADGGEQHD